MKTSSPAKGLQTRTCHCGKEFQPYRASSENCSPECKRKNPKRAAASRQQRSTPEGRAMAREYNRRSKQKAGHDPAAARERQLQHRHGMTGEDYDRMLREQGGVCAICYQPPADKGRVLVLVIDHNHGCCPQGKSCGQCRRGLLCTSCNRGIGYLRDDARLVEAAAAYLRRFS